LDSGKAVILLSGGLDSATAAAVALRESSGCSAITFRYGQRHQVEVEFARKLAAFFNIETHLIIDLPVDIFQRTALNPSSGIDVPKNRNISGTEEIPDTYVPARNTLFLAYALSFAESSGISRIYIGVNALDYSGYPDCRPEYIAAFERMANLGTRAGVEGRGLSASGGTSEWIIHLRTAVTTPAGTVSRAGNVTAVFSGGGGSSRPAWPIRPGTGYEAKSLHPRGIDSYGHGGCPFPIALRRVRSRRSLYRAPAVCALSPFDRTRPGGLPALFGD